MTPAPFDALRPARKLEVTGTSPKPVADGELVTKADLAHLKRDLTIRLGGMLAAAVAVTVALVKLL